MSTIPPPPPPFGYSGGMPPGSAPYDRRTLKAQRRASLQMAQFQRAQLREQMRAARRASIVGPALLLVVGTVLLLLETGHLRWTVVLTLLGRWWPGVLIAAGLVMLTEWALDRQQTSPTGVPLAPRRILGGGTTALLILLALLGVCVMTAQNGSAWARRHVDQSFAGKDFGDWRRAFGVQSEFTQELQSPLSPNGTLTVDDPRGDITVTGSSQDGQVHVSVHQRIFAWQGNDVEGRRRAEDIHFNGDPSHLVLAAAPQDQDDADLTIELPHEVPLTIHSGHGDISVEELRGAVDVSARGGDVKLTALRGPVHVSTQDDDAEVIAHSLSGGLTLEGHTGDITLSDVDGPVSLHGDFFGTTQMERIRGPVHFQSSFTDFACAGIPGDLNVEGRSDFDAHKLLGPVILSTTNRNLTLEGIRGQTTISDRNGSVSVALVGPLQPLHITNGNGSVDVSVPGGSAFSVDAQTNNGEIENDFGFSPRKVEERSILQAQTRGGGPTLTLQTTEGDLNLHRSADRDQADWSDTSQRVTSAPSGVKRPAHHSAEPSAPTQD